MKLRIVATVVTLPNKTTERRATRPEKKQNDEMRSTRKYLLALGLLLLQSPLGDGFAPVAVPTLVWSNKIWGYYSHAQVPTSALCSSTSDTSGSEAVRSCPPSPTDASHLQMVSFYRFWPTQNDKHKNVKEIRDCIFDSLCNTVPGVRGSLYIAEEGFNGQFAVPVNVLDDFASVFHAELDFAQDEMNLGDIVPIDTPTFQRLIVRTRDEILRDGLDLDLDWEQAGDELDPQVWDEELRTAETPFAWDCRWCTGS